MVGEVTAVVIQLSDGLASIITQIEAITAAGTDPISIAPTGVIGEFLVLSVQQA